jgi:beta-glucosidase
MHDRLIRTLDNARHTHAADHDQRWESDLDLMAALGLRGYRFSVAWTCIQPEGSGPVNQRGLDFYKRILEGLHARNITPMVTLYPWDLPQALQDRGGWLNRDTAERFAEYAAVVCRALGDSVPFRITLNEPWCAAWVRHYEAIHAPGIRDVAAALAASHHQLLAHGKGLQAMRAQGASSRVGITLNLASCHPASGSPADIAAARRCDANENRLFLDPVFWGSYPEDLIEHSRPVSDFGSVKDGDMAAINAPIDFLGMNYYLLLLVRDDPQRPGRGWLFDPPTTSVG